MVVDLYRPICGSNSLRFGQIEMPYNDIEERPKRLDN